MKFNLKGALDAIISIVNVTSRHGDLVEKYGWCRGQGLFLMASLVALGMSTEDDMVRTCYERSGLTDRRWGMRAVISAAQRQGIPLTLQSSTWAWDEARAEGYPPNSPQEALHAAMATLEDAHAYQLAKTLLGEDIAERMVPLIDIPMVFEGIEAEAVALVPVARARESIDYAQQDPNGVLLHTTRGRWLYFAYAARTLYTLLSGGWVRMTRELM